MTGATNAEQREYWNGGDSREWAEHPTRFDEMLAPFGAAVLEHAHLTAGERVLDVGCGNGATTIEAAEVVGSSGAVTGIDLSAPMIENARERARDRGAENVTFRVADAQVDDLDGPHDVAVSRFGVMFFDDPDAAFRNIARAVASGGRLSVVCWAPPIENAWIADPMAALVEAIGPPPGAIPGPDEPGPFRYGDPGPLLDALERAAFVDMGTEKLATTVLVGGFGTLDDATSFIENSGVTRAILGDASDDERRRAITAVRTALEPHVTDRGVELGATAWLVTGRRR